MDNRRIILVISGEICSGKTTLSTKLSEEFGFETFKTRDVLKSLYSVKTKKGKKFDRSDFQGFGESLDNTTNGKWVLNNFQGFYLKEPQGHLFIIDSCRTIDQITHLRQAYSYQVYHIHLRASPTELHKRFLCRKELVGEDKLNIEEKYAKYKSDKTELQVNSLELEADLVINTERSTHVDVFVRVASFLKLLPSTQTKTVDVLIGGQFGSEGKGQIAAHLAPEYDCLIRVGGPNAGHSVYEQPAAHIFHLLPSGTYRNPQAKILIGPGAVLNLEKILFEIQTFGVEDAGRLIIDENAIIISEEDIKKEKEIQLNISSTAQGVGFATANNITARLEGIDKHKAKNFALLKPYIGSTLSELEKLYGSNKKILLEGTQGTGLSLLHGIYPFVTSRDTTVSGTLSEAGISPKRVRKIIMVTRTYPIRVGGTSGPFISNEITWDIIAERSGKDATDLKKKEITSTTKRDRRVAEFSWELFRKACELNSPTDIALTFTDYISIKNQNARRYDQLSSETRQLIEEVERCSDAKVSLIGTCFDYRAIIDRRNWR